MRGLRCNLRFFGLKLYFFWGFKGLKPLINLAIFFKFNPPLRRMVGLNGISPLTRWKHCHSRQTNVNTWVDGYGCCEWYSYTNASDTLTIAITMGQHVGWRLRLLWMLFLHQRIGHINIRDNHGSTRGLTATVALDVILFNQLVFCHRTPNYIPPPTRLLPPRRIQRHIIGC